eukprot:TRINITY_DN1966_c0_g1_i1.p2 TRINITY_DN1966_c0_g1~~TRINITY_DN1966_c0_g1_i1.p2  ORF type:complete len:2392 (-),score=441.66 TRINITY_DN1966_c0_g1_i1:16-7191(-)
MSSDGKHREFIKIEFTNETPQYGDSFAVVVNGPTGKEGFLLDSGRAHGAPNILNLCSSMITIGIIITHPDRDHYGGLMGILAIENNDKKKKQNSPLFTDKLQFVLIPDNVGKKSYIDGVETPLLARLKEINGDKDWHQESDLAKQNAWLHTRTGGRIKLLTGGTLLIRTKPSLLPMVVIDKDRSKANAASIVVDYTDVDGNHYLLTGDSTLEKYQYPAQEAVKTLKNQRWAVVKISHHGSVKNVVNQKFDDPKKAKDVIKALLLNALNADNYVIDCPGTDKHPDPIVVECIRLAQPKSNLVASYLSDSLARAFRGASGSGTLSVLNLKPNNLVWKNFYPCLNMPSNAPPPSPPSTPDVVITVAPSAEPPRRAVASPSPVPSPSPTIITRSHAMTTRSQRNSTSSDPDVEMRISLAAFTVAAASSTPATSVLQVIQQSINNDYLQDYCVSNLPSIFAEAAEGGRISTWSCSSHAYRPSSADHLSSLHFEVQSPKLFDVDLGNKLRLQVAAGAILSILMHGIEGLADAITMCRFSAILQRSGVGKNTSWPVDVFWQRSRRFCTMTVWIHDDSMLATLPVSANRFFAISEDRLKFSEIPFLSAALPMVNKAGIRFTEAASEPGHFRLESFLSHPDASAIVNDLPFHVDKSEIVLSVRFLPPEDGSIPPRIDSVTRSIIAAGTTVILDTKIGKVDVGGFFEVIPVSSAPGNVVSYTGSLQLYSGGLSTDGPAQMNTDDLCAHFFKSLTNASNTVSSSLPGFLRDKISKIPIASFGAKFLYSFGSVEPTEISVAFSVDEETSVFPNVKFESAAINLAFHVSPVYLIEGFIQAEFLFDTVRSQARLELPPCGMEGHLALSFAGEGQQTLNAQEATKLLNVDVLSKIAALPGLDIITSLNLSAIELEFESSFSLDYFSMELNAKSISVCSQLQLTDATVVVQWFSASSAWSVDFSGKCNKSWYVSLSANSSAKGGSPATLSGRIDFYEGLHIDPVLQALFSGSLAAASIDLPPAAKEIFSSVIIESVSFTMEASGKAPRILRADFVTGLSEPLVVSDAFSVQQLSLEYVYNTQSTPKSTGSLTLEFGIGDYQLSLIVSKSPNNGWILDGSLQNAELNINDIIQRVFSSAPVIDDLFQGVPDVLARLPKLSLTRPVARLQTHPLQGSFSGLLNFMNVDCAAEVAVGKVDGQWIVGVALGSPSLTLSSVVSAAPSKLMQMMKIDGTAFAIVSSPKLSNLFNSTSFSPINSVLLSNSGAKGPLGIVSLNADFTRSSGAIRTISNILGMSDKSLSLYGLLSPRSLELDVDIQTDSSGKQLDTKKSFVTLRGISFFLQFGLGSGLNLSLGLKIRQFSINLLGETLVFNGRLATSLDDAGAELSIFVELEEWKRPFGVSFLRLEQVHLGATFNPEMAEEPISAIQIGAGIQLVKGDSDQDVARGVTGKFDTFVRLYGEAGFYLTVELHNCTFAHLFEFILGQSLPSCFNGIDIGFESLELELCTSPIKLLNGVDVNPIFRSKGDLRMYCFELYWDINFGSWPPSPATGVHIVAAAAPLSFCNDRIVLAAAKGSDKIFSGIDIPKKFQGGAAFVLDTSKPLLAFSALAKLFMVEADVQGSISSSGVSFALKADISSALKLALDCSLDASGFAASGSFNCDVSFDTPDVELLGVTILSSKHFAFNLDANSSIWINSTSMGFKFSGDFDLSFSIANLHIDLPTLDVDVPFRSLKDDAPGLISQTIVHNIGAILLAAIKNMSNLGQFLASLAALAVEITIEVITNLAKALGRGLEEVGRILKDVFKKAAEEIVNLLSDAYHVAKEFVKKALAAIGEVFEDIGRAICDAVDAVGNFFSGLFGGYSTARILKKLALIGSQLDDVQKQERQILDGLHDVEGGLKEAIGDLGNLETSFEKLDGQLWEIHGALNEIDDALQEINGSLHRLHDDNIAIQNTLHELAGEVDWRQQVLSVSDYVMRIQASYQQLLKLTKEDFVGAWQLARNVLNPGEGIMCALDGLHAGIMGNQVSSTGKSLLRMWAETAANISKGDQTKFSELVDQFLMHLQAVQQNGLILLINAFTLLGDSTQAARISKDIHGRLMQQLQLRATLLKLVTSSDCSFFSVAAPVNKQFVVIDHRLHELQDEKVCHYFGFDPKKVTTLPAATDLRTLSPMGVSFSSQNCRIIKRPDGLYLGVFGSARLITQEAADRLGTPQLQAASASMSDQEFCEFVVGDPIHPAIVSTIGFAQRASAASGAMIWEKGETGPRVSDFDLIRLAPSEDVFVVLEGKMRKISPASSKLFDPTALQSARWVPRHVAESCWPFGPDLGADVQIVKYAVDKEAQIYRYFIIQGSSVRAVDQQLLALCGFVLSGEATAAHLDEVIQGRTMGPNLISIGHFSKNAVFEFRTK